MNEKYKSEQTVLFTVLGIAIIILLFIGTFYGGASESRNDDIFQVSTLDALLDAKYDGNVTFGELKEYGDFGLGTLNGLDGGS